MIPQFIHAKKMMIPSMNEILEVFLHYNHHLSNLLQKVKLKILYKKIQKIKLHAVRLIMIVIICFNNNSKSNNSRYQMKLKKKNNNL